jgi:hypothetical protein
MAVSRSMIKMRPLRRRCLVRKANPRDRLQIIDCSVIHGAIEACPEFGLLPNLVIYRFS